MSKKKKKIKNKVKKKVKKSNPKINIIELDGIGHVPQVEDFERYRKALEVLQRRCQYG